MVKDAEENAEADRKLIDLVEARNSAERQIDFIKKDYDQYRDKLDKEVVEKLDKAMADLEEAKKGDDPEVIRTKITEMMQSSNELYRVKSEAEKAAAEAEKPAEASEQTVDAEFKEKPADKK